MSFRGRKQRKMTIEVPYHYFWPKVHKIGLQVAKLTFENSGQKWPKSIFHGKKSIFDDFGR